MKKTVLTFGLISGAIASLMMLSTLPFVERIGFDYALVIGYTTIVLSFMMIFFGIRSYRENVGGGYITFGKAFAIGILITIISCICYVGTWEALYWKFMPDFAEKCFQHAVDQTIASGASTEVVAAKVQEMKDFAVMYRNPLINVAFTFMEPFPVGVLITLISSFILRRKRKVDNQMATQAQARA